MKSRPILFSSPMIKAILSGAKTQTRRWLHASLGTEAILDEYDSGWSSRFDARGDGHGGMFREVNGGTLSVPLRCPYGSPEERLWVRETWCLAHPACADDMSDAAGRPRGPEKYAGSDEHWFAYYRATDPGVVHSEDRDKSPWRPSIFMPRWASRITLEITEVRVQRLQEIGEDDARAEGVESYTPPHGHISPNQRVPGPGFDCCRLGDQPHRLPFADLWDSINGKRAPWSSNPWVWCLTFRRLP